MGLLHLSSVAIGLGMIVIGAGLGIGKLAAAAAEGIARQPSAAAQITGAVNLPLTDFTAQSLARTIGDPSRRLLIYCNNNFVNNTDPVVTKQVRLALNIQTFINLHGYGYGNVYELAEAVDFNSPRVRWVRDESAPPATESGAATSVSSDSLVGG